MEEVVVKRSKSHIFGDEKLADILTRCREKFPDVEIPEDGWSANGGEYAIKSGSWNISRARVQGRWLYALWQDANRLGNFD